MRARTTFPLGSTAAVLAAALACARPDARPRRESVTETIACPKIWDDAALADWATPVAGLGLPPSFPSAAEYDAAPIDDLRTYPVYHPSREPAGYREALVRRGPQPLIEPGSVRTERAWIEAGRRVFEELDTAACRTTDPAVIAYLTDASAIDAAGEPTSADGVLLEFRWVVGRDGKLAASAPSCVSCHSRLMPDGSVLLGAPSNFDAPDTEANAIVLAGLVREPKLSPGERIYADCGVPWRADDPHARFRAMPDEEVERFLAQDSGAPPGTTFGRFNGSPLRTTRMADLIGVGARRYLDATGTHVNRGPADLARYCALVEFAEQGVFGPHRMLPEEHMRIRFRPPDEALFAMAMFLTSLRPPPNPNPLDERALRGRAVFEAEECADCHPPPEYTNQKLVPVPGFEPDANAPAIARLHVSSRRVDTDPGLALQTRKGTGFYRVPTLRGLWYRGLYEHSGSVASLEDWFDPRRLRDDYVPTGWRGPGVEHRAVPGHEFGLDLPDEDKAALIAFLKTL